MSDKREYNQIGKDIEAGVKEALFHGNWDDLNRAITNSVDAALDGVGEKLNESFGNAHPNAKPMSERTGGYSSGEYTRQAEEKLREERRLRREMMERERAQREARRRGKSASSGNKVVKRVDVTALSYPYVRVGNIYSTFSTVAGGIGLGITGISVVNILINNLMAGSFSAAGFVAPIIFGAGFGALLSNGISSTKLLKKAERYVELIGNKDYVEIKSLALLTSQTPKQVVRDLKKMMKKGFFPQGHLDEQNTNFILTDKTFNQYLETRQNVAMMGSDGIIDTTCREVDEEFPGLSPEEAAELRQMIEEGNSYISKVSELNDLIPGEKVSSQLDRLEGLLNEIFTRVREHPEQMSKMHELMDYYLPTVVKIVGAYAEYDKVSEPGEDIIKAKKDIENTLDTINDALSKLLNNLFKDSVWDVTTDAQVLKTVLAQKGLS